MAPTNAACGKASPCQSASTTTLRTRLLGSTGGQGRQIPCGLLSAALLAFTLMTAGCAFEPRYIKGDPVHEAVRQQKWPVCGPAAYPDASIVNEEQGIVELEVTVTKGGQPIAATLSKSSGFPHLDHATLDHVKRCRFEPILEDGFPPQYKTLFRFHWEMW